MNGSDDAKNPVASLAFRLVGAGAGLAVFLSLYAGLLRSVAFEELDLPVARAVGLIPPEELLSIGFSTLLPTLLYAGFVVLVISHFYLRGSEQATAGWRYRVQIAAATLILGPLILIGWFIYDLDATTLIGLVGLAVVSVVAIARHTRSQIDGNRTVYSIGWLTFILVVVIGGAISYARTREDPKLEPAAVLREGDEVGFSGYLIAETDDAVYLAVLPPLPPVEEGVEPGTSSDHIIEIPRDQILALAVDGLESIGDTGNGAARARRLLQLLRFQTEAAGKPAAATVVTSSDPIRDFAPEVSLTRDDPSFPTSADFFLDNSTLKWHHNDCPDHVVAESEDLDPARISGPGAYEHGPRAADPESPCEDSPETVPASEMTRPGDARSSRSEDLTPLAADDESDYLLNEGFYLDLENDKRSGNRPVPIKAISGQDYLQGVPAYYEATVDGAEMTISYWFFYPLSRVPARDDDFTSIFTDDLIHEGDWERVIVNLERLPGRPEPPAGADTSLRLSAIPTARPPRDYLVKSVRFHTHEGTIDVGWSDVEKRAREDGELTHPIVYSARASHATYPGLGKFDIEFSPGGAKVTEVTDVTQACQRCPRWQTWRDLVDATGEPWYGFGGAWGEVRAQSAGGTGPLGPSEYK